MCITTFETYEIDTTILGHMICELRTRCNFFTEKFLFQKNLTMYDLSSKQKFLQLRMLQKLFAWFDELTLFHII